MKDEKAKKLLRPLEGIRVIDLTRVWAGPHATRILGAMGAEVIKIEAPNRPDRRVGYMPENDPGERPWNRGGTFTKDNMDKLGINIDLSHPKGIALFKKLVAVGDVVVENHTPRVMKNLGVDYPVLREIRQDIIMISMPGFGMTGPRKDWLAWGSTLDCHSGLAQLTGYIGGPPHRMATAYGDPVAGIFAVMAVLMALNYRSRTGKGQYIDLAHSEALVHLIGEAVMEYTMNKRTLPRMGNRHPYMAPHGCYRCKGHDKWVVIAVRNDAEWRSLCQAMGGPDWCLDDRFASALERWKSQDELDRRIGEWTSTLSHYEVMRLLQEVKVPCGAVFNPKELLLNSHLKERGFFQVVEHPEVGGRPVHGPGFFLSKTPVSVKRHAPLFGQDNDYVFQGLLGLTAEEVAELERENVTSKVPTNNLPERPADFELWSRIGLISGRDPDYLKRLSSFYGVPIGPSKKTDEQ
ncbi:MAG: CoA transferase [Chloroflexi bacterium]|nr:CoA transferase [Chloroflexota bacterium]